MISKQKNIERLIARCENILSGKAQFQGKEWKLAKVSKPRPVSFISGNFKPFVDLNHTHPPSPPHTCTRTQYVAALDDQIKELEKYPRSE